MDVDDGCNFSFDQQSGNYLNYKFSLMFSAQQSEEFVCATAGMMSMRKECSSPMKSPCSSADVAEQFLATNWNPHVDFNGSSGISSYHARVPQSQGNFTSTTGVDQCQRPDVVNSIDLMKSSQMSSASAPPDFHLTGKHGIEKNLKGKKRKSLTESYVLHPDFPVERVQQFENEHQKYVAPESVKSSTHKDEKKNISENPGGVGHKSGKQAEECSQGDGAPKEDYIHIRAKRGQATNSHSLAERVRREKISERMKLLQDLVPGCNKINGKAMMLDKIINYVQSLQRQVEFLSMKLSAVNPDLPFDIEQILSKDFLHSRDGNSILFGCGPPISTSYLHFPPQMMLQPKIVMCNMPNSGDMMRSTIPQVSPMTQLSGVWDDELQTVLQMGFIPNPPLAISDPSASMKMDE